MKKFVFVALALLCLTPWIDPPLALALGMFMGSLGWQPYDYDKRWSTWVLQFSVVCLGFGMGVHEVFALGWQGIALTGLSGLLTLSLGWGLARMWNIPHNLAFLLSVGTAICGGSAIAAVAPVLEANEEDKTLALSTVFLLNAMGLVLFPMVGFALALSQPAFGLWSALAIHDTSAVVGAASQYGAEALQWGTSLKLQRALWIIPLVLGVTLWRHRPGQSVRWPWFIGLFLLAVLLRSTNDAPIFGWIALFGRQGLSFALFLTGANIQRQFWHQLNVRALAFASILWVVVAILSLELSLRWLG